MNGTNKMDFESIYIDQIDFQRMLLKDDSYEIKTDGDIPNDYVKLFQYHCLALLEEAGELLKSDKRWKNFRNKKYDKENKLEEVADCFVTLFNISIFSGFTSEELFESISKKIKENKERYLSEKKEE